MNQLEAASPEIQPERAALSEADWPTILEAVAKELDSEASFSHLRPAFVPWFKKVEFVIQETISMVLIPAGADLESVVSALVLRSHRNSIHLEASTARWD